jgi:hypothetical protein
MNGDYHHIMGKNLSSPTHACGSVDGSRRHPTVNHLNCDHPINKRVLTLSGKDCTFYHYYSF